MRGVQAAWADPLEEERKSGQYAFYTIYICICEKISHKINSI